MNDGSVLRPPLGTAGMGHEERFPPPRLSDRYRLSKETVARVPGSDRDAP